MNRPEGVPVKKLDWKTTLEMINKLAHQIEASGFNFDYIYGIPRGGLIPAVILSHKLKIEMTDDHRYKWVENTDPRVLFIDDISDIGETLEDFKTCDVATLHIRHDTKFKPNFFVEEIKDNTWIQYPWETQIE